jgi:hypothetical protein
MRVETDSIIFKLMFYFWKNPYPENKPTGPEMAIPERGKSAIPAG